MKPSPFEYLRPDTLEAALRALSDHKDRDAKVLAGGQSLVPMMNFRVAAPEVIQLQCYNKVPAYDAPFTRRNLFERDAFTCQYCGKHVGGERMSIDHVTPRSKGGKTNWQNCVLACVRCNSAKGDRTLREAGLRLLNEPRPPRWTPYLNIKHSEQLESWAKFTASHRAAKG